ncbi:glycosyltransferase family 2 protein [Candidatus Daviesbacteria bacterium]|nr:glycosyltransferase family 2 protein [Candidatus Daviesbacteria bacterium]
MISVTIITLNEEKNLRKSLISIKNLADEIIVVDSGSNDNTVKIAKEFGAKVFFRKFDNFANQKNWAMSKASNDWILSVDADEEISNQLADEIKVVTDGGNYNGFLIPRKNFILGKEIKYSRWSPDEHIWLWKKASGKWTGDVHEEVIVKGKVGKLKYSKLHYSHKTINQILASNNFYSTLLSQSMYKNNIKFSIIKMFWNSSFEFSIRFFYKLGFLDGWRGFVLAYIMGIYQLTVWVKLWELHQEKP